LYEHLDYEEVRAIATEAKPDNGSVIVPLVYEINLQEAPEFIQAMQALKELRSLFALSN
jgi:hypothetical protein